jgi:hypothetical protein
MKKEDIDSGIERVKSVLPFYYQDMGIHSFEDVENGRFTIENRLADMPVYNSKLTDCLPCHKHISRLIKFQKTNDNA